MIRSRRQHVQRMDMMPINEMHTTEVARNIIINRTYRQLNKQEAVQTAIRPWLKKPLTDQAEL